jgi:hypothetical protein
MANEVDTVEAEVLYENDATAQAIEDIRNGRALAYSSINAIDMDSRMEILEAVTNSEAVREHLKELVFVKDIIIQRIAMADQQTGEMVTQPRLVYIVRRGARDGESIALHAISQGLLRSVNNLIGVAQEPSTWTDENLPAAAFALAGPAGRQYLTMKFGKAAYELAGVKPAK